MHSITNVMGIPWLVYPYAQYKYLVSIEVIMLMTLTTNLKPFMKYVPYPSSQVATWRISDYYTNAIRNH